MTHLVQQYVLLNAVSHNLSFKTSEHICRAFSDEIYFFAADDQDALAMVRNYQRLAEASLFDLVDKPVPTPKYRNHLFKVVDKLNNDFRKVHPLPAER